MSIEYKVVVTDDGDQYWYLDGKYHREDGPAIIYADGEQAWYLNDIELTEQEFNNHNRPCVGKVVVVDGIEYTLT